MLHATLLVILCCFFLYPLRADILTYAVSSMCRYHLGAVSNFLLDFLYSASICGYTVRFCFGYDLIQFVLLDIYAFFGYLAARVIALLWRTLLFDGTLLMVSSD